MIQKQTNIQSSPQKQQISLQTTIQSPIQAVNRLKSINDNIQALKNRIAVLKRREQYHQFKTINHSNRINYHQIVHNRLKSQRQQVRKSLQYNRDTTELKNRSQTLRRGILERINSARNSLRKENKQKYSVQNEISMRQEKKIAEEKKIELESKKDRAESLRKQQEEERLMAKKKLSVRRDRIVEQKAMQSSSLNDEVAQKTLLLKQLQHDQFQLLQQASKSMQTSKAMSRRYQDLITLPTIHRKTPSSIANSTLKSNTSRITTNSTTLQVIIV